MLHQDQITAKERLASFNLKRNTRKYRLISKRNKKIQVKERRQDTEWRSFIDNTNRQYKENIRIEGRHYKKMYFENSEEKPMLILQRHPTQPIWIGENIKITILGNTHGNTRIGIEAPRGVPIRSEALWNTKSFDKYE